MHEWGTVFTMNTTTETVAANVRRHLEDEGYTAKNLADRLEVSYSQATRLMNGKSAYRPEYIATLSRMMGMDAERLIGVKRDKEAVYLTVQEAARVSKYHPDTIRKAVYRGEMRSTQRVKGGKYLIREADLGAWMAGAR